ncbi:MAG: tetratricopeptide repeat protein [Cyanobacteria bacterium SZAS TMP-1]|nr:tetratricopeptide repeat protein [Cyanobacteria bacterium SZAS TMP-1]
MNNNHETNPSASVEGDGVNSLSEARAIETRADKLCEKGAFAESLPLLQQVLVKRIAVFGPDDLSLVKVQEKIADIYIKHEQFDQADNSLRDAQRILESHYHTGHSCFGPICERQADILAARGKFAEAEPLLRRASEIYTNTLTMENRATLRTFYKLAKLYIQLDRPEDARKTIEKAMKYVDTPLGPVSEFRFQMALAQVMSKNNNEAKVLLKDASEGFRQRSNYMRVVECLQKYADICRECGEYAQAEVALKEAERYQGLEHFYPEDIFVATLLRA